MPQKSIIQASEQPIAKIFSSEYSFIIPDFQRPYSWGRDQVDELLDDLTYFAFQEGDVGDLNPYFLGSIVVIKGGDPAAKVIDGQQRLTTLTILFTVLRELLPDLKESITKRICEPGDEIEGILPKVRLSLRKRDQQFFEDYIQRDGGFSKLSTEEVLSDSQTNIRDNTLHLKKMLEKKCSTKEELRKLVKYLVQKCYLVVVSTSDDESAYRIFSVLNDRGMQLSNTDILKAEIIGAIPEAEQDGYTEKWENIEEELRRDPFNDLFTHIRMIKRKVKAKEAILKEIREHVKPKENPKDFIDRELIPYAAAFDDIKKATFESTSNADDINKYLRWLNKIGNDDWVPPAISFLEKWGRTDTDRVVDFMRRLERLAFGLHVMRININGRIERYGKVLSAIENGDNPADLGSSLSLSDEECQSIRDALAGSIYGTPFAKYLLLRLDAGLSAGEAKYDYPIVTIEHVLPQNPANNSEWLTLFSDEDEREELTHCLGNLVLLSRRKNSGAQNYEFDRKKSEYFAQNEVCSFALTTEVLKHDQWTPEVVYGRQNWLLARCSDIWKLGMPSNGYVKLNASTVSMDDTE